MSKYLRVGCDKGLVGMFVIGLIGLSQYNKLGNNLSIVKNHYFVSCFNFINEPNA